MTAREGFEERGMQADGSGDRHRIPGLFPVVFGLSLALAVVGLIRWNPHMFKADEELQVSVYEHRQCVSTSPSPSTECEPAPYDCPSRTWLMREATGWILSLTGISLFHLRLISVFSGILFVLAVHPLGCRLFDERTARWLTVVTATSPNFIRYWTTGDEYAPHLAFTFLMLWRLLVYLETKTVRDAALMLIPAALAIFWVYPSVQFFLPLAAAFGLRSTREGRVFALSILGLMTILFATFLFRFHGIVDSYAMDQMVRSRFLAFPTFLGTIETLSDWAILLVILAVAVLLAIRYARLLGGPDGLTSGTPSGIRRGFERRLSLAGVLVVPAMLGLSFFGPAKQVNLLMNLNFVVHLAIVRIALATRRRWVGIGLLILVLLSSAAFAGLVALWPAED